ncbi:hypothetical protein RYX36_031739, partial [Vicia faba]
WPSKEVEFKGVPPQTLNLNPTLPFFSNLQFLSKSNSKKYLKLVDYHIVREGKYIDYSLAPTNSLLLLDPHELCAIKEKRVEHHIVHEPMTQEILDAL